MNLGTNEPCLSCGCRPHEVANSLEIGRQNISLAKENQKWKDALKVIASGVLPNGDHVEGAVSEFANDILKEVNINTKNLKQLCSSWDDSQSQFQEIVSEAMNCGYMNNLISEFEVAEFIVNNWANGVSNPHPRIKEKVVSYLSKL